MTNQKTLCEIREKKADSILEEEWQLNWSDLELLLKKENNSLRSLVSLFAHAQPTLR